MIKAVILLKQGTPPPPLAPLKKAACSWPGQAPDKPRIKYSFGNRLPMLSQKNIKMSCLRVNRYRYNN